MRGLSILLAALLCLGGLLGAIASSRADEPAAEQTPASPTPAAVAEDAAKEEGAAPPPVSFQKEIAPLLVQACLACHGDKDPQGEYQLTTFENLTKHGYSDSPVVTPGKPAESELYNLISAEDADVRMPKEADPLSAAQVALVHRWIVEGAKYDAADPQAPLASILPPATHVDPPESYRVALPVTALAFHPQGTELAVGGYYEITIWNPVDGALLRRIKNVAQRTYGLAYSPDGSRLATASGAPGQMGEVRLYDAAQGTLVAQLGSMSDVAFDVAFSPDGAKIAACGADRSIRIFDVATGQQEVLIEDHADWVLGIAWSPDGARLASASRDKTAKLFDAKTGDALVTYPEHGEPVYGVAFNADGTQVLSAGRDKRILIWNPADGKQVAAIGGFGNEVFQIAFSAGQIYGCSADKTVRQFAAENRAAVRSYAGHADWIYSLAISEPTRRLATGSYDGEVRVWNLDDGALITTFRAAPGLSAAKPE